MAQGWRHYLEAGMQVGEMTRAQAQRLAGQLVKEGQLAEERARAYVDELIDRSRHRAEDLRALVRREVEAQLSGLGLATKADVARLERRIAKLSSPAAAPRSKTKTGTASTPRKGPAGSRAASGTK